MKTQMETGLMGGLLGLHELLSRLKVRVTQGPLRVDIGFLHKYTYIYIYIP